ncbi:unnamed protein product [Rotaria sordida]|nr:unnamed protein product [Rotaria sordida]
MWNIATQNPHRIHIFHDESIFRSGGVSPKRCHMVSDFLVEHPSGPVFELSEDEWKQAVAKYKKLTVDSDVDYLSRTATASINIGTDAYFDNDTILNLRGKLPYKVKLAEIHEKLAKHPAFRKVTKLEMLARKYNMKIIYCPKYHCELNVI